MSETDDLQEASRAEADRILTLAGWRRLPGWDTFSRGTLGAGIQPDGMGAHVKDWAMIGPEHPHYSADTPDTPHEAAQWLADTFGQRPRYRYRRKAAPTPEPAYDPIPESPPAATAEAVADSVDSGNHAPETDAAEGVGSAEDGSAGGGLALLADDGQDEPGDSDLPSAFDADYEEIGEPAGEVEGADLEAFALTDQSEQPQPAPEAVPEPGGGVVYFGDDIHVARLAKMGRLAEIARERKAALHEGWTVGEFASLQNLLVRIERGEAPDDGAARARFLAISERSRAMSAIDAYQNSREDELERYAEQMRAEETRDQARDAILAFNPDDGWPQ